MLRGQTLTPAQFVAFARRFGPPEPHVIDQFHHPGRPEHPDPVERRSRRRAERARRRRHVFPHRLLVPRRCRRARRCSTRSRCRQNGGNTLFANQYAAYDDLPERDEAADRAARRAPSLRQSQRPGRGEPHRGLGAHRRAEGEDAAGHAPGRAPAPGDRAQGALRGVRQLVRHRRHARRRGASRCSTSSPRMRRRPEYRYSLALRRRRRRDLGQRVAAALGDAHRSGRSAHAVADHRSRSRRSPPTAVLAPTFAGGGM